MSDPQQRGAKRGVRRLLTPNRLRWSLRAAILIACCLLLVAGTASRWSLLIPAASPLVTLCSLLVTRTLPGFGLVALIILAVLPWQQRWFCRWFCPMGFCADKTSWVGRKLGRRRVHWPAVGQWIAVMTLAGACIGYPLFLWLDPLAMLSAAFVPVAVSRAALWYAGGLALVLLVSLIWPNLWCANLCPLGGMQDSVFGLGKLVRTSFQRVRRHERGTKRRVRGLRRRTVLGVIIGVVWSSATLKVRGRSARPLRPPGAVEESAFTGLCIRCGNCSRACPTRIITHDGQADRLASLLTPIVTFEHDYCLESCNQCTGVCPTGAIGPVSMAAKSRVVIGVPVVDMNICLLGKDRDCSICRSRCPYEAIKLVFSEIDYTLTPQVDLERCPGCGACQLACPTSPRKAIVVCPVDHFGR